MTGRQISGVFLPVLLYGLVLFAPAGTVEWPRAWIFLGVVLVASIISMVTVGKDEALLRERSKPPFQAGQPRADQIVLSLFLLSYVAFMVFIPIDVFRLHLLADPADWLSALGMVMFVAGWWIIGRALWENTYAVAVVRYQAERSQKLIDTGPYRLVRHPMYSGFLPLSVGMALWLESSAAAWLSLVPIAIIAYRTTIEERLLVGALAGYDDYRRRVRYRLIPFVW